MLQVARAGYNKENLSGFRVFFPLVPNFRYSLNSELPKTCHPNSLDTTTKPSSHLLSNTPHIPKACGCMGTAVQERQVFCEYEAELFPEADSALQLSQVFPIN